MDFYPICIHIIVVFVVILLICDPNVPFTIRVTLSLNILDITVLKHGFSTRGTGTTRGAQDKAEGVQFINV